MERKVIQLWWREREASGLGDLCDRGELIGAVEDLFVRLVHPQDRSEGCVRCGQPV